ncbi:hypothetical protein [Humibacter sp.]|jgi:hypothetical protein|uniref:hypothetical protein n=1 Tax=Humibacter sp. TaxID=1940291 RepID=UPI003F7EA665
MAGIGGVVLTWLVVADTWMRTTAHAEPTALAVVALVVAVGVLAIGVAVAVRVVLSTIARVRHGVADRRPRDQVVAVRTSRPETLRVGGRGARAPGVRIGPASSLLP